MLTYIFYLIHTADPASQTPDINGFYEQIAENVRQAREFNKTRGTFFETQSADTRKTIDPKLLEELEKILNDGAWGKRSDLTGLSLFPGGVQLANGGGQGRIYKVSPPIPLSTEKGEDLALKIPVAPLGVHRITKLSQLNEDGITEFFPQIYGLFNVKQFQSGALMTWVDTDFEKEFREGKKISDSVIFETTFGSWAGLFFHGIKVNDIKSRNFGLKQVTYGRAYLLGDQHYYFPPGLMPVRVDVDDSCQLTEEECQNGKLWEWYYLGVIHDTDAVDTAEGKIFVSALKAGKNNLFNLFSAHFEKYKIADPSTLNPDTTRFFEISPEDVTKEQNRFLAFQDPHT